MTYLFAPVKSAQFRRYSAATLLSAMGNGMHFVAMLWLLYDRTGVVASIGGILIITTLPAMFISPFTGALVDRWNKKWICVIADSLRGLIFGCLVLALSRDQWVVPAIYTSSFLAAVCNLFFTPASAALVRDISRKESLLDANILSSTGQQIGLLCGASLGGFLVSQMGAINVILLNTVSFIISASITTAIHIPVRSCGDKLNEQTSILSELHEAINYAKRHHFILWLALVQIFDTLTISVCNTLLPVFVIKELNGGSSALGLIEGAWGGGAILGGILLGKVARRIDRHLISVIGPGCLAVSLIFFLLAHNILQAVAGYFVLGIVVCAIGINTNTVLASDVEPSFFGKIKSAIAMFNAYISLAAYGLISLIGDHLSSRMIYGALSAFIMIGFLIKFLQVKSPRSQF